VQHVFTPDDRTGNILTTIALFAAVAGVAFAARATVVVLVLSLLLAYLLEPLVAWVQGLLPGQSDSRTWAIALVYLITTTVLVGAGYALEPTVAGQMQRLNAAAPDMLARLTDRRFLAEHSGLIAGAVERATHAVAAAAENAGWLLMVPIVAVFFLKNRAALIDGTVDIFARRLERASVKRTVQQVDAMLAQYLRAQVVLAGLSSAFYAVSMALLGFPYPIAFGVLGGALEFLPVVGWILAAVVILTSGWLTHAPWIWMAGLIVTWRIVQNFVNSPRIMGDRLDMEPLTVILALMVGSQIGGLLGVLLSVPIVAVLRILWLERSSRQKAAVA
jgi:predicted PurR-regulated permease PerM